MWFATMIRAAGAYDFGSRRRETYGVVEESEPENSELVAPHPSATGWGCVRRRAVLRRVVIPRRFV